MSDFTPKSGKDVTHEYTPQSGQLIQSSPDQQHQALMDQRPLTNAVNGAMDAAGVGSIPVLRGVAKGLVNPVTNTADIALNSAQDLTNLQSSQPNAKGNLGQAVKNAGESTGRMLQDTVGNPSVWGNAAEIAATAEGGPGIVKGGVKALTNPVETVKNVVGVAKNLASPVTKLVKTGAEIVKSPTFEKAAAKQATGAEKGADVLLKDIEEKARGLAGDKQPIKVSQELDKLLSRLRGGNMEPTQEGLQPSLSSPDMLKWRQQLDSELPKTFFDKFKNRNDAADKAVGIVRKSLADLLHESAPGTVTPDKLLSIYSKLHGDIPTQVKRIVGGAVADKILGNKLGGIPRDFVDIVSGLVAGGL